eukprot:12359357-Alexandrium_andersonii.AAC.1
MKRTALQRSPGKGMALAGDANGRAIVSNSKREAQQRRVGESMFRSCRWDVHLRMPLRTAFA